MQLESRGLDNKHWEQFLPDALHSIRSLLCTATNATPHERLFNYNRRTSNGCSLPAWLTKPGPILLKRHVRASKYDALVEEAELLEANPNYAHVKLKSGVEKTVSLRDLAPIGQDTETLVAKTPVLCIKKTPMNPVPEIPNDEEDNAITTSNNLPCTHSDSGETSSNNENVYVSRYGRQSIPVDRFSY